MHVSYAHTVRNATETKVPRRNNLSSCVKSEKEFNNYIGTNSITESGLTLKTGF